jgi:hypothetical protein
VSILRSPPTAIPPLLSERRNHRDVAFHHIQSHVVTRSGQ